jgi:hypothetical protein
MDSAAQEFLPQIIGILDRLQAASASHNQPMLASLIDLARSEAEDALRTLHVEASLRASLRGGRLTAA